MNASSHTATTPTTTSKHGMSWFSRMFKATRRRLTKKTKEVFPFLPINEPNDIEEYHNPILGIDEQYMAK